MTSWAKGAAQVEQLLADLKLQRVAGAEALVAGHLLLDRGERPLRRLGGPVGEHYVRAGPADAGQCLEERAAVLAQQGLRATREGGHVAVESALRAQFEPGFADFGYLRRRRNELEYPGPTGPETTSAEEARQALADATAMVEASAQLLPALDIF